jgi:hypothetical protein
MSGKNTILILTTSVALLGTGILLVADSFSLIVGRGARDGYVYSQSRNLPAYLMRGCPEPYLPECGLIVW